MSRIIVRALHDADADSNACNVTDADADTDACNVARVSCNVTRVYCNVTGVLYLTGILTYPLEESILEAYSVR